MGFTPEQREEVIALIKGADSKGSGTLDEEEMRRFFIEFQIDVSFVPAMMRVINKGDRDSEAEYSKICDFLECVGSPNETNLLSAIFAGIDMDHDGKIGINEIIEFGELINDPLSQEEAKEIIKDCDFNGTGEIEYRDFLNLMHPSAE